MVEHIRAKTFHKRSGAISNHFTYAVDYVLIEPDRGGATPRLFSRNRHNLVSFWDHHHGGPRGAGRGTAWVRDVFRDMKLDLPDGCRIFLLAQPKTLFYWFPPVSFWMITDAHNALIAVIAEVNNTFGDRHSYLCMKSNFAPITPKDELEAQKLMHVSPFQPVTGKYQFMFTLSEKNVAIRIAYTHENGGVLATLVGPRDKLTNASILKMTLGRPFGALRVVALIHYQAVKLWWKKAHFYSRPKPPEQEVSKG